MIYLGLLENVTPRLLYISQVRDSWECKIDITRSDYDQYRNLAKKIYRDLF